MSITATKRKYKLTISHKLKVDKKVDKKVKSKTKIAKEHCVPLPALSTYLKNCDSIEKMGVEGHKTRIKKRIQGAKRSDLETELFEWFCDMRANNIPISRLLIKEKADNIELKLGITFQCSNAWLHHDNIFLLYVSS